MTTSVAPAETKPSLLIGLHAAKANVVPGLIVQAMMLLLVVGYYCWPSVKECLDRIGHFKGEHSLLFSAASAIVAGAWAPEVLKILCFQRGKPNARNFHLMVFATVLWGISGMIVDTLYHFQTIWFGNAVSFAVIAPKVIVDQFIYNPILAAPMNTITYDLATHGLTKENVAACFTWRYYRSKIVPCLIATWGVWIPLVCIIYSLPPDLQIPLFALALTFWALLLAYMSRGRTT